MLNREKRNLLIYFGLASVALCFSRGDGGSQSNKKISAFASIGRAGETKKGFCASSYFLGHILEFHGDASLGEVVGCGEVVGTHTW